MSSEESYDWNKLFGDYEIRTRWVAYTMQSGAHCLVLSKDLNTASENSIKKSIEDERMFFVGDEVKWLEGASKKVIDSLIAYMEERCQELENERLKERRANEIEVDKKLLELGITKSQVSLEDAFDEICNSKI